MRYHPAMSRRSSLVTAVLAVAVLARIPIAADDPAIAFEPMQADLFKAGANFVNAFADVDGDHDLDLFVGFDGTPNRLYRNDRGVFVESAAAAGVADARATRAAAFGDADADGDPDLLLGFTPGPGGPVLRFYRNDGGRFSDQTIAAGLAVATGAVRQPAWVDADGDGDLDLFVGFRDRPNALFRNDGGMFTDAAPALGLADPRKTVGAVWFDADEDGDLDLAVANMDGDANGLFRTAVASPMSARPPAWLGADVRRRIRPGARCASVLPTWTAMAGSICLPPTTDRSAISSTAARAGSKIARRPRAWRSTPATTPVRPPTSITTAGRTSM
jgi:hypothetical protein